MLQVLLLLMLLPHFDVQLLLLLSDEHLLLLHEVQLLLLGY